MKQNIGCFGRRDSPHLPDPGNLIDELSEIKKDHWKNNTNLKKRIPGLWTSGILKTRHIKLYVLSF